MSSSGGESSLASNLECPVCLELYVDPCTLSCGHNFCKGCLDKADKSNQKPKKNDNTFTCPVCRGAHVMGRDNAFVVNTALREIINEMKKIEITNKHGAAKGSPCANFEKCGQKSMMYCSNCRVFICKSCTPEHSTHFATRAHVLTDTSKKPVFPDCDEHTDEKSKFFCETCEQLVCNTCVTINHRNEGSAVHKIVSVADASGKKRKAIVDSSALLKAEIARYDATIETETKSLQQLEAQIKSLEAQAKTIRDKIPTLEVEKSGVVTKVENLRRISNEPSDFDILDKKKYEKLTTALKAQFGIDVVGFFESLVVPDMAKYQQYFLQWMPTANGKNVSTWKRLYRGSSDGFDAASFHGKCDNKGATITFIKAGNNIFGGYASMPWDQCGTYKNDTQAFLFTLVNQHSIPPTKYSYKNNGHGIYCRGGYGPTWGGGHDLGISDSASYSNFPHSYTDTTGQGNATFAGAYNFNINEIEVFLVPN